MTTDLADQANALLMQRDQLNRAEGILGTANAALDGMESRLRNNQDDLDALCVLAEEMLEGGFIAPGGGAEAGELALVVEEMEVEARSAPVPSLDLIDIEAGDNWASYFAKVQGYADRTGLTLSEDPFANLLSPTQRIALEKRIRDEFSLKNANCDKFDYMIAGTCGFVGGLIDVFFVGLPGQGTLTKFTDDVTDNFVQHFARLCGWRGPNKDSNPTASAIGFLENGGKTRDGKKFSGFKVNYDQPHSCAVDGRVKNMSTSNHHIKSLAHSPDLVGLFFSILDQFTNTAHFVDGGKVISINTSGSGFELKGSTFVSKIFAGFVNWLGHLVSDIAGSSGTRRKEEEGEKRRGSGIPIPFFSLLQFINVGEFGQHKQTFAKVAVQVFEKGYDFRHGMALAIPVLATELLIRVMWTFKQRFHHDRPWTECVPSAASPELRRMFLVGHGTLCIVDGADAAFRSGGDMIQFMLRSNLIGWARFGTLALKELRAWYRAGSLDCQSASNFQPASASNFQPRLRLQNPLSRESTGGARARRGVPSWLTQR
ncbi:MAG TPA: hypothetical protein VD973_13855, partial [Symbiobacteriaceae bacterium]|nr:hypothetical protein [Symbiobacteriaceae bacterium]